MLKTTLKNFFVIVCLNMLIIYTHCELTSVIKTDKGPVQGEILETTQLNHKFSSFRGIRYGKPPIGRSRFMVYKNIYI